jgi:tRNA-dihydrouridine synthase C
MEGVTHRVFRDVILDMGGPGAAWTEFLRVSQQALRPRMIRRELGEPRDDVPVGVQLMGIDPGLTAESAANAVEAGAPMVDLNFGCPAPRVFNKCAGSALLAHPEQMRAMVAACVDAVEVPVTAKIRLGVDDDGRLREIVAAVEDGGAALLSVHARTRADRYKHPARWEALPKVRAWTRLPLIGNGDVLTVDDAYRMLALGVDGVMIGRGAIRDPWLLHRLARRYRGEAPPQIGPAEVLAFHRRYRDDMRGFRATERGALGQLKQIYRRLEVGMEIDDASRTALLRSQTIAELDALLERLAARSAPVTG